MEQQAPGTEKKAPADQLVGPVESNIFIILAILTSVLVAAIDTLVTAKSFYFHSVGTISETSRQLYIQGTTILATILTKFVVSQAQKLLLRNFDRVLHDAAAQQQQSETRLRQLGKKWRSILQTSSIKETWTRWSRFGIFAAYFLIGLMTAAMVTYRWALRAERVVWVRGLDECAGGCAGLGGGHGRGQV